MFVRRNVLLKAIVDEVEERVYHSSIGEDAAEKGEVEDEIPELQVHALIAHEVSHPLYGEIVGHMQHDTSSYKLQLAALLRSKPTSCAYHFLFGRTSSAEGPCPWT